MALFILLLIALVIIIYIEFIHYITPKSPLILKPKNWTLNKETNYLKAKGVIEIYNQNNKMEVMVSDFNVKASVLSKGPIDDHKISMNIKTKHPDLINRKDNYWEAYIVKSKSFTNIEVSINITGLNINSIEESLDSLWIEVNWKNYGPFGYLDKHNGFVVPILLTNNKFKAQANVEIDSLITPIKTHILGSLDDPIEVIENYCSSVIKPGDILTIGETPLAIMQGRYISPKDIIISPLARFLCQQFHPTSSLATACGMQTLINLIGPSRAVVSWLIGGSLKIFGIKGVFYRLAGNQARLIDDITGTTAPYDKTIVLGPNDQEEFCTKASKRLGVDIAIVDVNDLGKVKVLQSSNNRINTVLTDLLKTNPAGNADQHTPLVLIRPDLKKTTKIS